jgi:nickel superoxide dismutase
MFYEAFEKLDRMRSLERAKAHCDIPCGIYDPHLAQVAALTAVRMVDLMTELQNSGDQDSLAFQNSMSRYIAVKEEHAELCKHEIRVIWGDFIKPDHLEKYPELSGLVHQIMQYGSKSRQTADREMAMNLLNSVNRFAEIFWDIKGVGSKKVKAPYAPGEEMVLPAL